MKCPAEQRIRKLILLSMASLLLLGCFPEIKIDEISPYGDSGGTVSGHVTRVNPTDYTVLCYIEVEDVWWTKPYAAFPITGINEDGTWTIDITTGGNDRCATKASVFLVSAGTEPVICGPCTEAPDISGAVARDLVVRTPPERTIGFAGKTWKVKSSPLCPRDPGPNYFSDREEDVYVDENGHLVMWLRYFDGKWWATEVIGQNSYGYGTYKVVFNSRVDLLDPNEIGAAFLFDRKAAEMVYREIDMVEFTKWGDPFNDTNAQFVVHPCNACPGCGENCARFRVDLTDTDTLLTVILLWKPGEADFWIYKGDYFDSTPPPDALIHQWSRVGEVPEPGEETVRFNFWLLNGEEPRDSLERRMVIENFGFEPTFPNSGNGINAPTHQGP